MLDRTVAAKETRKAGQEITLESDSQYQEEDFVQGLWDFEVSPNVKAVVSREAGNRDFRDWKTTGTHRQNLPAKRKNRVAGKHERTIAVFHLL
jgi:hypothetical protein